MAVDWGDPNNMDVLNKYAGKASASEIAAMIPGATRSGIIGKLNRMQAPTRPVGRYINGKLHDPKSPAPRRKSTQQGGVSNPLGNKVRLFQTSIDERQGGMGRYKLEPVDDVPLDIPNFLCVGVSLVDLKGHQCRWPLDSGLFCGAQRWVDNLYGDSPYCAPHHRRAHRPVTEHKRLERRR